MKQEDRRIKILNELKEKIDNFNGNLLPISDKIEEIK